MTTAGLIIKHKQDHQDKTGHGQEGLRSAHCLLHLYDCPAFGSSGTKRAYLLSIKSTNMGGGKAALPENEC